eukprot:scaffold143091_cov43-Attheya_sp.AAC.2
MGGGVWTLSGGTHSPFSATGCGWCILLFVGSGRERDVGAKTSDSAVTLEVEVGDGASLLFSASLSLFVVSGVWENGTGEALDGLEFFWREK